MAVKRVARRVPPAPPKKGLLSATGERFSAYICATCGAPLIEEDGKYRCRGKYCPLSGCEHDKELLERMHRRRIMRLAIGIILSIIPLIFPGGPAGLVFMLGILCLAFEFYFPFKPRDIGVMVLKGIFRSLAILFITAGFYLLALYFLAIIALFIAYFTLPTGIAEIPETLYNVGLGIVRTFIAAGLAVSIFVFIGGPVELRASLALFTAAFFVTVPVYFGELIGLVTLIVLAYFAFLFGLIALGAEAFVYVVQFFLAAIVIYGVTKISTKIKQAEEERKEKEEKEKKELEAIEWWISKKRALRL
jgi:hypothetical protein